MRYRMGRPLAGRGRLARLRARENCFVRDRPGVRGRILGIVPRGATLRSIGRDPATGWHAVAYMGGTGWVSGRYVSGLK